MKISKRFPLFTPGFLLVMVGLALAPLASAQTAPEIEITGLGNVIPINDTTPGAGDGTDFGSFSTAGTATAPHAFIIHNLGTAPLNVSAIQFGGNSPSEFLLSGFTPGAIAPGGTMTFNVSFDPGSQGTRNAWVTVYSDDSDEGHYLFTVQGIGTTPPVIRVMGGSATITNNSAPPALYNTTDFGNVLTCGATVTRSFLIYDYGSEPLTITNIVSSNPSEFTIGAMTFPDSISNAYAVLYVTFKPAAPGARMAIITITNNDSTANPFSFAVGGNGLAPAVTFNCTTNKSVDCGSAWTFDVPAVSDSCGSTNVTVSILSTVTNGVCPQVITRTWQASEMYATNVTCSQTVTLVDTTPPAFVCVNQSTAIFSAGTVGDDFAGPEPAFPSAGLLGRLTSGGASQFKGFDDCADNTFFAHTFTNLPGCITAATLHIRLKCCNTTLDANDILNLGFTDASGKLLSPNWGRFLGNGNGANGLFNTNWGAGSIGEVVLDLSQLPNADGSTTDLVPQLNAQRFFDLVIEDDTSIDFAVLTVTSCCINNKMVDSGTAWNFDAPTATDNCSGTNVALTVLNTTTNGVCPQVITRTWLAVDLCGNTNTYSQTVTVSCVTNAPGSCTNFVVNGSFEITSPAMSPGSFDNTLNALTGVPGWMTAATNSLEVWCNTVGGIPATDGTNQLEINAQSADETVSQTVTGLSTTCPVTFCFDYTGRFGSVANGAGPGTPNNDFTVSITGKDFAFSVPLNPVAYATGGWLHFCTNFVPPDASFTIAFHGQPHYSDGTIATQGGSHIDNVSLTQCCLTNTCTTPPIISCPTNTIVVALNKDCLLEIPTIQPKATDACTPGGPLTYLQDPTAGTVVAGTSRTVTLIVQDARGNASQCQVKVYGQDKTPPTLVYPKSIPLTNCEVPNVLAFVSASDPCTPTNKLIITQSPPAGTLISPGVNQVSVTVTDPSGNATTQIIPLITSGGQSFLNVMFNTGVDANKNVLTTSVIDPHYTLGPVPPGTQTGPSYYNAPNAVCESSFLWLPPLTASRWIDINDALSPAGGFPAGNYTYTNHFVLPVGVDPLTASISGRWATCASATMYLNGLAPTNQVAAIVVTNLFPPWNSFIINSGILAYPAVNNLYFVVTNIDAPFSSGDIENPYPIYFNTTRLRVEYIDASSSCGTCTPPTILQTALNQSRPLNGTAVFNATVGGTPPFTIVWYHNGHSLTNGGHYSGATTTTLTVSPLSYADAGTYEADVYGPCGKAASAPAKLTVTHGWGPWQWAWWDFHDRLNPMKAAIGPDLVLMTSTNIFGISSGSTFDFGLPNIGGRSANVLNIPPMLPSGTFLELPAVGPLDGSYVSNYTLIADIFVPSNSPTRSMILSIFDRWGNMLVTASPTGTLSLSGTLGAMNLNQDYSMALLPNAWNRVALVIETTPSDAGSNAVKVTCLSNLKQLGTALGTILPSGSNTVSTTTVGTSANSGTNGEIYLSAIQFHATAFTPEMLAGLGLPASGPLTANDTSVSTTPMMSAKVSGGMVNFMWSGGAFLLQETTNLSSGAWMESNLPFDEQSDVSGKVMTTAHADPTMEGPTKYYRLIYQP